VAPRRRHALIATIAVPSPAALPLDGVRVVDLTTVVAGPYATLLLADLGADVIKIEAPTGDVARGLGPHVHDDMAAVFLNFNRNKRSVVLDLRTDDGRRRLKQLTDTADVFVHNMRPDAAVRCGASADDLCDGHAELVYCAMHGFRSTSPYRDLAAYDDVIQAASGVAAQQEWLTDAPAYMPNAIGDKVSGLIGALAITAALRQLAATGRGSVIEVPMAEALTAFGVLEHLWGRTFVPPRGEARYPRVSARERRPYATSDGWLSVVVYTDENWRRFFAMIGRPELSDEARFATLASRTEHLDELFALVADNLAQATTQEWFDRFRAAGIPAVPYNRVDDLFTDEYLADVGFWETVDHPTEGRLLQFRMPMTFDGERPPMGAPAPRLGADTDAVLAELDAREDEPSAHGEHRS
jgi:crotonobetainyl-CoA:carnitine CoA-transferase CaiB-like acyl-CoA transferase